MKNKRLAHLVFLLVLIGLGWLLWSCLVPHRSKTDSPLPIQEARKISPISLPDTATDIYIATYMHWVEYSEYIRFKAPLAACLKFAEEVTGQKPTSPTHLEHRFLDPPPVGWPDGLLWFDVENVQNAVVIGGGPSTPKVVVDMDRNIVYYSKTD